MKLAPGVHLVHTRVGQSLLVEGPPLTLIDTGARGSLKRIERALRRIGRRLEDLEVVIITHAHSDHLGEASKLKSISGARVLVHHRDLEVAQGNKPRYSLGTRGVTGTVARPFRTKLETLNAFDPVEIDGTIDDGEIVGPGLEVFATPGHTPGHCSIYMPEPRLLHAGDAVFNLMGTRPPPMISNQNEAGVYESIVRLPQLQFRCLSFGHGPPIFRGARRRLERLARKYRT